MVTGGIGVSGAANIGTNVNIGGGLGVSSVNVSGALTVGTTASVTGIATFSDEVRNVQRELFANVALSTTQNFAIPTNFRELTIVIRSMSISALAQVRLIFKAGTTVATHAGVTDTSAWNAGYAFIANPAIADNLDGIIRVFNTGPGAFNSTYSYVVSGTMMWTASQGNALAGSLNIASASGAIDNLSFVVSAGAFDLGRISIYATYCT